MNSLLTSFKQLPKLIDFNSLVRDRIYARISELALSKMDSMESQVIHSLRITLQDLISEMDTKKSSKDIQKS